MHCLRRFVVVGFSCSDSGGVVIGMLGVETKTELNEFAMLTMLCLFLKAACFALIAASVLSTACLEV